MFQMKMFAIILTILFSLGGGGGGGGGGGKKVSPRTPKGIPPNCGAGKKARWNATTQQWECVPIDTPDLPDVTDDDDVDVINCPTGMHFDATKGECVPDNEVIECPPGMHFDEDEGECVDDEDEPAFDPDFPQIIKPYPAPGNFYQVVQGDQMLGVEGTGSVTWRALVEAGIRAAMQFGQLSNAGGMTSPAAIWAKGIANEAALRLAYKDMILCGGWTDRVHATFGWCDADCVAQGNGPGQNSPGPHGRAVRFLPQHPDNRARLESHQQPIRNMRMLTAASEGKGNGVGAIAALRQKHELLYLPDLDLKALWEERQLRTTAKWPDGGTKALPPKWVLHLGLEDRSGSNLGVVSGCGQGVWGG